MKLCHLVWTSPSQKGDFKCYQKNLSHSTEILWDISDLPFVQNKDYQYSEKSSTKKTASFRDWRGSFTSGHLL